MLTAILGHHQVQYAYDIICLQIKPTRYLNLHLVNHDYNQLNKTKNCLFSDLKLNFQNNIC